MYKLIALDIDGTLLNSDKKISNENKAAIAAARTKGVRVVLVSGRPTSGMRPSLKELGMDSDDDYVLSFNASVVQRVKSKTIIRSQILTGLDAKKLAKIAQQYDVDIHAFSHEKGLITPSHNDYTNHESDMNDEPITLIDFEILDDNELILKVMLVDKAEKLTAAINQLPASLYEEFTIMQSAPYFLEFLNKNSNKGIGVKALADHLSIPMEQVICMGDAGNDYHMIKDAGLGIAMGNATDDIKAVANYITATNDEHGVAKAIQKFVLDV